MGTNDSIVVPNIVVPDIVVPNIVVLDRMGTNDSIGKKKFTVYSAGFNNGNYLQFSLGETILISKKESKRGITVVFLTPEKPYFKYDIFDFYKENSKDFKIITNNNFISFINKIPDNTYFGMSIKDDAYRNLFEGTKNFLSNIIGCKKIWNIRYRYSWCVIVYKKSKTSYSLLSEDSNEIKASVVQYLVTVPKPLDVEEPFKTLEELDNNTKKIKEELLNIEEPLDVEEPFKTLEELNNNTLKIKEELLNIEEPFEKLECKDLYKQFFNIQDNIRKIKEDHLNIEHKGLYERYLNIKKILKILKKILKI